MTIIDKAGNPAKRSDVYITALGIKMAVETLDEDATVYIAEEQVYTLSGMNKEINFTADVIVTLRGISTNVIIDYTMNKSDLFTIYFNSTGTLYLDTLSLSMSGTKSNDNAIGNMLADTPTGSIYLKNIKKDPLNYDATELVDIYGASVYYWNGIDWTQVSVTGGGWVVSGDRKTFIGTEPDTYWQ